MAGLGTNASAPWRIAAAGRPRPEVSPPAVRPCRPRPAGLRFGNGPGLAPRARRPRAPLPRRPRVMADVALAFLWHQHQPYFRDDVAGETPLPWARLRAARDAYGLALLLS